ncbi:MAG: rhodanese homology domain-containing protein [Bacteroidota bacterium]
MRFVFVHFPFLLLALGISAQGKLERTLKEMNTESVPYISVVEATALDSTLFLDTRKKTEYSVSHLKDAVWVGYEAFEPSDMATHVPEKDTPIVVYCSIGVRSEDIGEKLLALGYTDVRNLYGGIFAWKNQGFPVFDAQGRPTERVHAFDAYWGKLLKEGEKVYDTVKGQ